MSLLYEKYKNKGLSGLANLGNSCYLNACMQIFSHTYEFNDFLSADDGKYKSLLKKIPESIVLLEWDKLRCMLWTNNSIILPHDFVKTLKTVARIKKREIFTGYDQNDIQEYLLFVIECFHTALSREVDMKISGTSKNETDNLAITAYKMMQNMYAKDYSKILDMFYGIHVSQIKSIENNSVLSMTAEPFSIISLSIPHIANPNIFDCLDLYCNNELLSGDDAWYNEKTKLKESVERNIIFWSLPDIMIIDLKRSKVNHKKTHTIVNFPLQNADFSKYVKGYNAHKYVYDLYGVCNHSGGGGSGGHYFSYIKNANGLWYNFNDTNVKEISEAQIISSMSYCLFYRKKK